MHHPSTRLTGRLLIHWHEVEFIFEAQEIGRFASFSKSSNSFQSDVEDEDKCSRFEIYEGGRK